MDELFIKLQIHVDRTTEHKQQRNSFSVQLFLFVRTLLATHRVYI